MGPAADGADESDGQVRDLVYRKSYILHGDLGAKTRGGKHPRKTGERGESYSVKGESLVFGYNAGVSLYRITTERDRFIPDLMAAARAQWRLVGHNIVPIGLVNRDAPNCSGGPDQF